MKTTIGKYDPASCSVPVTFETDDVKHERFVNACLKNGVYDKKATAERVAQVALGVAAKIEVGAIVTPVAPENATEVQINT